MKRYQLTAAAENDLLTIWLYIAEDNPVKADEVENDLFDACQKLADRPDLGHFRRDLTDKPVRFYTVRQNYLIVFNPASHPLQIIRVLHGARDAAVEIDD